jgi:DNA-binding IscR family transcriptional regulator
MVNDKKLRTREIAAATKISNCLVTQILNSLANRGKISTSTLMDGSVVVHPTNFAELKRMLR